jgi:hypothetical protein
VIPDDQINGRGLAIAMNVVTNKDAIKTITTHYIDEAFVESHGREVMIATLLQLRPVPFKSHRVLRCPNVPSF